MATAEGAGAGDGGQLGRDGGGRHGKMERFIFGCKS